LIERREQEQRDVGDPNEDEAAVNRFAAYPDSGPCFAGW
jgi:hypothetical protein